jgi:transcription elongation GreA/GreB family factor
MDGLPNKTAVRAALKAALEKALGTMIEAARQSREGAVHEESRPEGDKDMRATEQSYVARGQAMRAEALAEELARFEATPLRVFASDAPIAPGALVRVTDEDEDVRVFFLVPQGGGTRLEVDGFAVTVVTPASPVGAALVGRRVGDDLELSVRGALRDWLVEAIG